MGGNNSSKSYVGVYVDVENLVRSGGYGMRFDILREFACRDESEPIRLNAYVSYDNERAKDDDMYKMKRNGFFSLLRDFGFKVIEKKVKWYKDEEGNRYGKANADLDLAVDALLQSDNLNRVILATGDGDFVQVVRALQNKGCRVEVVAFDNVSQDLKREADMYVSGYLIPNLLPFKNNRSENTWGDVGSRVRGVCSYYNQDNKFGYLRFIKEVTTDLWKIDVLREDSPYESARFSIDDLPMGTMLSKLPSRNMIFEFELCNSDRDKESFRAGNIKLVHQEK